MPRRSARGCASRRGGCGRLTRVPAQRRPLERGGTMTPHTLCTIAVRFLGLLLAAWSLPTVGRATHDAVQAFCMGYGLDFLSPFQMHNNESMEHIGSFAQLGIGLYLFLGGGWVIRRLTRGLDGTCPRCGYDTAGNQSGRCPECGTK